ncbi:glycoside hydrolase family 31 protein [Caldisalinibacter kiritimatiensis]|uniref:Alpha-glucosidase n=1 Tax=Caldisalinibacter kiritimatiensis TaxID=1304284 RepID=R1AVW3_9FIRM|nr:glycoside hydrolase family 31 protein [Caldisalinibacter kiritimatiensis]EOD00792.1 Alpha-glucosidase [Caldisalinibacter kiritimatiensis]
MIRKTTYGYTVEKKDLYLDIAFYADNIVRFAYSTEEKLPDSTLAVIAKPQKTEVELEANVIKTNQLKIVIDEDTLKVSIYDLEGNLLSRDKAISTDKPKVEKQLIWENGFYGVGEKYAWLNKKGTETANWNTDVLGVAPLHNPRLKEYHTSIPFYIGLDNEKAYGIYFDNSHRTYFDFGKTKDDVVSFSAEGGNLDYYFIYDKKVSEVVKGYSLLTGTMPLPRKDFLGYQQCRWSYENREQLMEVATRMRKEGIPCDVLYLDIDYMVDYKVFTVDSEKFNEFREMLKRLKGMGYKVVVIIDPGVKVEEGYSVYEDGKARDYYVKDAEGKDYVGEVWPGDAVFPDFLRKEVREWWAELHKDLLEDGVEGIWNDMNEPSDFSTETKTIPEDCVHKTDDGEEKLHSEIHNMYGTLEAIGTYEGLRKLQPNKRPFLLTRAAFAGCQRYAALWTGDNSSIWEHLESSMPMFMNLGLSGYTFIGADVGGFDGDSNGELLARWTQLGAFTPLFRNHSAQGTINQEPWCFGEETLEITKKYIKLRYEFITYLYNLMRHSSLTGEPVMRPLFYHYQNDEKTHNINDQFLYGENIMVCPIVRPGADRRMIYIPEGEWYDYWTGEKIEGGQYIIKEAPIDILPIYVKAGAILPKDEVVEFVGQEEKTLHIHFYAGANGEYDLYLDDGMSFEYEDGVYSLVKFTMEDNKEKLVIKSEVNKDNYKIPALKLHIHGVDNKANVTLNGENLEVNEDFTVDVDKAEFELVVER